MNSVEIELEYEGETFVYSIELWIECESCGYQVDFEDHLPEETCVECGESSQWVYVAHYHYYIKYVWWFEEPTPDLELHTKALRAAAMKLEALTANGWEMTDSDGEHVNFRWKGTSLPSFITAAPSLQ